MGALRFKTEPTGPFLNDDDAMAVPHWTRLRELEAASLALERDDAESDPHYAQWLAMLIAPGSSLGGARPKASVVDELGHPWIAKFPSGQDPVDVGGWEWVAHQLARKAGVKTSRTEAKRFGSGRPHTFLVARFDRAPGAKRVHFASAMTLLQRQDGDDADAGVSYLELARFIVQQSAQPNEDLEQLWRRIVFSMAISNVDDHLRNHGFLLSPTGWLLSPAYDLNPVPDGTGLTLNVSETDNALDFDVAREVAPVFRLKRGRVEEIITEVKAVARGWREEAKTLGIRSGEQDRMARAFRLAEAR
jgi:serine/threonine-protein kinase HipA